MFYLIMVDYSMSFSLLLWPMRFYLVTAQFPFPYFYFDLGLGLDWDLASGLSINISPTSFRLVCVRAGLGVYNPGAESLSQSHHSSNSGGG